MNRWRPMLFAAAALLAISAGAAASLPRRTQPDAAPPTPAPTSIRRIDEYGNLRWGDEKARLDNFAVELQNDPTAIGYLICYDGRIVRAARATRRCERAAKHVIVARHIDAERVRTIYGGFREELTVELYVVPADTMPPEATPTVDPREVTFIKAGPRRKPRRKSR